MAGVAVTESNNPNFVHLKKFIEDKISELPKCNKNNKNDFLSRAEATILLVAVIGEMWELVENQKKDAKEESDKEISLLKEENAFLREKIVHTKLEQEKSQQYQNRDTFKICGIKEPTLGPKQHEDTVNTVTKFFEKAGVSLPKEELSMTHRVPTRDSAKSKALLVKLRSRIKRNELIRMKKDFRDNELLKREYPDAFIVEHLTPLRAKVCYKLRHDETIEKVWTIDGRIKIVKKGSAPTDKPITIDSLAQLTQLGATWTKKDIENLVLEA